MGSFVVRSIFSTPRYSKQVDAFVFASTAGPNPDEDSFKDQFAGKSGSVAYGQDGVEAMSGATVTSTAVKNAVNAGLDFYETVLKGGN